MVLEIITVLSNPDVCLNPDLSLEQRAIEECVSPNEVRNAGLSLLAFRSKIPLQCHYHSAKHTMTLFSAAVTFLDVARLLYAMFLCTITDIFTVSLSCHVTSMFRAAKRP